jgi:hypothetical protein
LLPVAANGDVNAAIAAAFARSGLKKREVARRVWGDAERYRDLDRYMKPGGTRPGAALAVLFAAALDEKPHAFLGGSALEAVAKELLEANERVASLDSRLQELESTVSALPTADDLQKGLQTVQAAIDRLAKLGTAAARQATTKP